MEKRALALSWLTIAILLLSTPSVVQAQVQPYEHVVNDKGTNSGCPEWDVAAHTYATIGAAVTAAMDGDRIFVCPGTYTETVNIDKGLSLLGPNAGISAVSGSRRTEAIIDAGGGAEAIRVQGGLGEVTIDGFRLTENWTSNGIFHSFQSEGTGTTLHVLNNIVEAPTEPGGYGATVQVCGDGSTIIGNHIEVGAFGSDPTWEASGILIAASERFEDVNDVVVQDNHVQPSSDSSGYIGIAVSGWEADAVVGTTIKNNTVENVEIGIGVYRNSVDTSIENNTVQENRVGVLASHFDEDRPAGIAVHCNKIVGNGEYGVLNEVLAEVATNTANEGFSKPKYVDVYDDYAVMARHEDPGAIFLYDISEAVPVYLDHTSIHNGPNAVEMHNGYAYASLNTGHLKIMEVSDVSISVVGSVDAGGQMFNLNQINEEPGIVAMAGSAGDGLVLIDVTDKSNPTVASKITFKAGGVDIKNDVVYITDYAASTLRAYDVSNPNSPALLDTLPVGSMVVPVRIYGDYAYVQEYSAPKLHIVDISTPSNLTPVLTDFPISGPVPNAGGVYVDVEGDLMYVTTGSPGQITVYDVSDKTNPVQLTKYTYSGDPTINVIDVTDEYVYVPHYTDNKLSVLAFGKLYATQNWWNDPSGPSGQGSGGGDAVSANVDFATWLSSPGEVTSLCGVIPVGGETMPKEWFVVALPWGGLMTLLVLGVMVTFFWRCNSPIC